MFEYGKIGGFFMDQRLFIFKLKHLRGIGNKGLLKIFHYFLNHPEEEFCIETCLSLGCIKKNYQETFIVSFQQAERITENDFHYFLESYSFLTIMDEDYPDRLREIYNPPIALFYLGNKEWFQHDHSLAMIGSRESTPFGKQMIESLVPSFCQQDITIVSGLAKGNDTFSHQSAIRHQGKTIAVIGCGLNTFYPKENQRLQQFIAKEHLLVSEYIPNTKPLRHHFPSRNRIIAGLSKGTCVIESKRKSGTFITAQLALEEGRDVFAVPGNPFTDASEGCLSLIQAGAKCIWKAEDILEEWQAQ